jgi:hypothetical protein
MALCSGIWCRAIEVTIRASAVAYMSRDGTFLPSLVRDGFGRYQAVLELPPSN